MTDKRGHLRSIILSALDKGELKIGSKLPTEAELTQQYGVSRATVREGIATLVQDGILCRRRRAGTFVSRLRSLPATKTVAVIVACVQGRADSANVIVRTIEDRTHEEGYSLILCNHDNDPERIGRYVDRVVRDNVAGVIFSPLEGLGRQEANLEVIRQFERHKIPFVLLGNPISVDTVPRFSIASSDGFTGSREMVRHLVGLGHRRIAYITFPGSYSADTRLAGYREEMHSQGLPVPSEYIQALKLGPVELQGQEELIRLMALPSRPTAIMCVHDLIARNVMEEAYRQGLRVPEDVAVVGFGDMPFAGMTNPSLTTVACPVEEEGTITARMLFDKISGEFKGEKQMFLPCKLVIRQSTGGKVAKPKSGEGRAENSIPAPVQGTGVGVQR